MKRELDITYPPLTSFTHIGVPLSIIPQINENNWFLNNYINFAGYRLNREARNYIIWPYPKFAHHEPFDVTFPFTDVLRFEDYREQEFTPLELVKNLIDRGRYVYMYIDTYFLNNEFEYKVKFLGSSLVKQGEIKVEKSHHAHEGLIYGYDDSTSTLAIAQNMPGGIFGFGKLDYKALSISGEANSTYTRTETANENVFKILAPSQEIEECSFDADQVSLLCQDFLTAKNSLYHVDEKWNPVFGLGCINEIIVRLRDGRMIPGDDVRFIHVLSEHSAELERRESIYSSKIGVNYGPIGFSESRKKCNELLSLWLTPDVQNNAEAIELAHETTVALYTNLKTAFENLLDLMQSGKVHI